MFLASHSPYDESVDLVSVAYATEYTVGLSRIRNHGVIRRFNPEWIYERRV